MNTRIVLLELDRRCHQPIDPWRPLIFSIAFVILAKRYTWEEDCQVVCTLFKKTVVYIDDGGDNYSSEINASTTFCEKSK